ncbi:nucleotide-sugar transporter-domain-containing protein [Syncephalastrum racemosum]|uniref:Nucleotide-sugar transporter-domain-containing protein n=1 Tax=Syncephalastrum racemosum TaxID=13706 RepID=A0A1X2HTZ4_SYNRA|nr:nucleotide-sugar transporter-domain-containing protein [Syncephalastrum racemosum]
MLLTSELGAVSTVFGGIPLKYLSLLILVVQNSALILVMRYTRAGVSEDEQYLASTAVVMSEVIKTIACMAVLYCIPLPHRRSFARLISLLHRELFVKWRESAKLAFPAVLYLIQNNLQYVAATNLDAATFQVTYQLKILTTAFFSVALLNKSLSRLKWAALGLLTVGIGLVVLPKDTVSLSGLVSFFFGSSSVAVQESDEIVPTQVGNQSNAHGFFAVLMACILSGLAGVYFEKILKAAPSASSTKTADDEEGKISPPPAQHHVVVDETPLEEQVAAVQSQLWIRNIQMSFFSVLLGLVFVVLLQDGTTIAEKGFFVNYTPLTWLVIGIQAFGGLVVALVVKYADNILKGFATSISIILSSLLSIWLFNFSLTGTFVLGAAFVIYATYLYGL